MQFFSMTKKVYFNQQKTGSQNKGRGRAGYQKRFNCEKQNKAMKNKTME